MAEAYPFGALVPTAESDEGAMPSLNGVLESRFCRVLRHFALQSLRFGPVVGLAVAGGVVVRADRRGRGPSRLRALIVVAAVSAVVAGLGGSASVFAASRGQVRLPVPRARVVPVSAVKERLVPASSVPLYAPAGVVWPSGSATVTAAAGGGFVQAGGLPVALRSGTLAVDPSVRVTVAAHAVATAAGVDGLLVSVQEPVAGGRGPLSVQVDTRGIAGAYGGDFGSRLRLVELPACALSTPQVPSCRQQTSLPTSSANGILSTTLSILPQKAATSRAVQVSKVIAVVSGLSGGAGNFGVSLRPSDSWSSGASSGAFVDSYPLAVPPVPGGVVPSLALDYDSQSVDGDTSATNNQASPVGDGWNVNTGFIQRSFESCSRNPAGASKTNDECWSANNVDTLSFDGTTTQLVYDAARGWHAMNDSGQRIVYCTGVSTAGGCLGSTVNGTSDNGYWVLTTRDGTRYAFGLSELPGWAAGKATTDSAWTVPVYSTATGQPCYSATFAKSVCSNTAWRWNLDYVVDTRGDAASYWYTPETNYYAADEGTKGSRAYQRGGHLSAIDYGQRAGSIFSATAAGKVTFTYTGRCTQPTCAVSSLTAATASAWPDVPYDLLCGNGAKCANTGPSFFTEYALTTVATQTLVGSALRPVDSWVLKHSFPATGDPT